MGEKKVSQSQNGNKRVGNAAAAATVPLDMNTPRKVRPDGGWGWVVVFASMIILSLASTCYACFGLIFPKKLATFGVQTTAAAWLLNIQFGLANFMSPFAGPLANIYSHRKIAFCGGLLCGTGFILTAYAPNATTLYFTYSILVGVGVGMANNCAFLLFTSYFDKRQGIANGLFITGNSFGNALMPQLVSYLMREYGFSGCCLILGGLMFNICAAACVFHPVAWHMKTIIPAEEEAKLLKKKKKKRFGRKDKKGDGMSRVRTRSRTISVTSASNLPGIPEENEENASKNASKSEDETLAESTDDDIAEEPEKEAAAAREEDERMRKVSRTSVRDYMRSVSQISTGSNHSAGSQGSEKALAHVGSAANIFGSLSTVYTNKFIEQSQQTDATPPVQVEKQKKSFCPASCPCVAVFRLIDFTLLKDPCYVNMAIGGSLVAVVLPNFNMLLPIMLNSYGFPQQIVATVLSGIFLMDLIFKVVSSYISDFDLYKRKNAYMVGSICMVGTVLGVSFVDTYTLLLVFSMLYGCARGVTFSNMSLMYVECFGMARLPSAFGIANVLLFMTSLAVAPIIGYVRDTTLSYALCLQVVAAFPAICVVMWTVEKIILCICSRRKSKEVYIA